jgi:TP901 family phage tail tape measure protein
MVSARGIKAGAAYVELLVSDNKLVRGLKAAQARLKGFGEGVSGIGRKLTAASAAVAAPLLATSKVFIGMGDAMAKASDRTGIAVETLSELTFAAEMSGANLQSFENGIRRMQRTVVEAADGTQTAVDALAMLGLRAEELQGMSPDRMFKLLAERLSQVADPTHKAAIAMEIFGRGGAELLPLMKDGVRGIEALQDQARELGLTLSTEAARDAERFGDTLDVLWKVIKRAAFAVGAALAPTLTRVAETITRVVVQVVQWIDRNRGLIVSVTKLALAGVATGMALVGIGYAIQGLAAAFGGVAAVITGAGAAIGLLGTALAALLSPVGLVIAGAVALGAYIAHSTGVAGQALAWLSEQFRGLKDRALVAYQGIADALAAGDIALAARVLWLALKVEWQRGIHYIQGLWLGFKDYFLGIAVDAFYGAVKALATAWHGLRAVWVQTISFLAKGWTQLTSGMQSGFRKAQLKVEEGLHRLRGMFDESYDVDMAINIARTNEQADQGKIEQQRKTNLDQSEQQRQQDLGRIGSEFEAEKKALDQAAQAAQDQRRQQYQKQINESMSALEAARKEYRSSLDEAAQKRRESDAAKPTAQPSGIDDLLNRLAGLGDTLEAVGERTEVRGTFNAAAIQSLMGTRTQDRIAAATEQTANHTKRLVDAARSGGLAFE